MVSFQVEHQSIKSGSKNIQILTLKGHLDTDGVPKLKKKITELIEAGEPYLVFAMEELVYVSSAGLGLFLATHRRLGNEDGFVFLANVHNEVLNIMKLLGFERILPIYEDLETALQATVSQ